MRFHTIFGSFGGDLLFWATLYNLNLYQRKTCKMAACVGRPERYRLNCWEADSLIGGTEYAGVENAGVDSRGIATDELSR